MIPSDSEQLPAVLEQLRKRSTDVCNSLFAEALEQAKNPKAHAEKKLKEELAAVKRRVLLDTVEVERPSIALTLKPDENGPETDTTPPRLPMQQAVEVEQRLPAIQNQLKLQLEKAFQHVNEGVEKKRRSGAIGEKHFDIEHLSLLDDEELSFQILINQFTSFEHEHYSTNMTLLCMRFERATRNNLQISDLPLSPDILAECFRAAITEEMQSLDSDSRIALFSIVLENLNEHYGQLIQNANNLFIRQGIMPDLNDSDGESRYKKSQEKQKIQKQRKALLASLSRQNLHEEEGHTPRMGEVLESLNLPDTTSDHQISSAIGADEIQQEELLVRIQWLDLSSNLDTDESGYLKQGESFPTLAKQLEQQANEGNYAFNRKNSNTIGMMSMLFEDLFNNDNIGAPIKALLAKLQGPLLKAAIQDEEFFADTNNPAQEFLNMIAEQGAGWAPDKDPQKDFLYLNMAGIVDTINNEFDDSYSTFEDAIDSFEAFLEKHRQRTARIEERIVAAEKAQARLARAKQAADDHIDIVLGRYIMPEVLATFIDVNWKQVLFYIYNTYDSKDNEEWRNATNAEMHLIAALNGSEKTQPKKVAEVLGKQMLLAGQEKSDVNIQLKKVLPLFIKTEKTPPKLQPVPEAPEPKTETAEPAETETLASADIVTADTPVESTAADNNPQLTLKQLQDKLTVGTWLSVHSSAEEEKVKVAAFIKHTDTYILVKRNGSKFGSFNSGEMLEQVNQQQIRILESSFMFDRALESVISNIRQ